MKNIRGFALGLALGLAAAVSTIGLAQDTKPVGQNQKAESCCKGDSCSMKDHAKKDGAMTHSGHEGCCCCCGGDSCDMKMKEKENKAN
ncbi:MAG TPA: hypothetical protein VJU86_20910 [Pyrinomonadaceae bacterium]|nr:hypothetical protein [Pyrinomonadaceae bacterium]